MMSIMDAGKRILNCTSMLLLAEDMDRRFRLSGQLSAIKAATSNLALKLKCSNQATD